MLEKCDHGSEFDVLKPKCLSTLRRLFGTDYSAAKYRF